MTQNNHKKQQKNNKKKFQHPQNKKFKNYSHKKQQNTTNKINPLKQNKLLDRYDNFFEKGTSNKLLEAKTKYSKNQFIRINLSKTTIEETEQFLKKNRVKYSKTFIPNAIKIEKSFFNISSSINSILGKIYIQDLASQIPVNCININSLKTITKNNNNKTIKILDMAASPGSKTTQIADLLEHNQINYEITALEPEKKRLTKLINNIQKQQIKNIKIFNSTGQDFKTNEKYDLILLDAPCSGNLIGDTKWLQKRDIKGILQMSEIQKQLLKKASNLLQKNGQLIYSTCSLEPEENELNIEWILNSSNLKTTPCALKFPFNITSLKNIKNKQLHKGTLNALRFMPYNSHTQGFFVCCFEKK